METFQLLIIVALLALLAEVTYLVVKLPRQTIGRKQSRPIFVDTSVLIDGRIMAVASSGFVGDTLVIPRSVIAELQFLADNADHEKRARARHGLDIVTELQNLPDVTVEILQDGKATEGVDERLLSLAKKHQGVVCTIDYNLNKVAVVEGIKVLNVNELAQTLRMAYLPGEKMLLELVQKGQDAHQGVGYLPDGTMVVVENSNKYIGQKVEIEFIRSLQTAAGKMMFARRVEKKQPLVKNNKPIGKKPQSQPKAEAMQTETQVTTPPVYHSDTREQQLQVNDGNKSRKNTRNNKSKNQKQPVRRDAAQGQASNKQRSRTSAEREAALIDLVDKM